MSARNQPGIYGQNRNLAASRLAEAQAKCEVCRNYKVFF
jgi:hypothetical protein